MITPRVERTPARRRRGSLCACAAIACCVAAAACGRKTPVLPSSAGAPFPDFASAYTEATAVCRDVKTMTASMALSGKSGRTKLRGRIDAGFAAPAKVRLEGRAPFGRPVFVLTADGGRATLVLPRDDRVLANAPPEQVVEALAGVALSPDTLRTIVAGCGMSSDPPSAGRSYGADRAAVTLANGTASLQRVGGKWRLTGAALAPVDVFYGNFVNGRPSSVRLRTRSSAAPTDLTLRLSEVETNTSLDPRTFEASTPEGAVPLTLEELRKAGPLGDRPATKGTKGAEETKRTEGAEVTKGTEGTDF
jgi:outer membrane lipoprotein-sorting protein